MSSCIDIHCPKPSLEKGSSGFCGSHRGGTEGTEKVNACVASYRVSELSRSLTQPSFPRVSSGGSSPKSPWIPAQKHAGMTELGKESKFSAASCGESNPLRLNKEILLQETLCELGVSVVNIPSQ